MKLLATWVHKAHQRGASDVHLESGFPAAFRIMGALQIGEQIINANEIRNAIQDQLSDAQWDDFCQRKSIDLSLSLAGIRCRLNIFQTVRGLAASIRLFRSAVPNLDVLNLHPSIAQFLSQTQGLLLICGATGSGKSSTTAALIQEINRKHARHIIMLEQPIEYILPPQRSQIRQREVGRDTPSFEQGLLDSLRQDPDVIVVGEMRKPETIRLTLNASETGHLVIATLHSANVVEALQRIVASFPASAQPQVCAQLGDCLVGVVSQQLVWNRVAQQRVPVCEVLRANTASRGVIRQNQLHRLNSVMELGHSDGMWTRSLYQKWLDGKKQFAKAPKPNVDHDIKEVSRPSLRRRVLKPSSRPTQDGVFELDENTDDLASIVAEFSKDKR